MKIGFFGFLTVLFVGLKLTEIIDWSWWFVVAPLWAPPLVFVCGITLLGIVAFLGGNRK